MGLYLIGPDDESPESGPRSAGDPRCPKHDEQHHRGHDEVRVPRLAERSDPYTHAVDIDGGSRPQSGDRSKSAPQEGHGGNQGGTADRRRSEVQAWPGCVQDPHEGCKEIEDHRPWLTKPDPAVRPDQLVEMSGAPGAEFEESLIPVQDHVGALNDGSDGFHHGKGADRGDGEPAGPAQARPWVAGGRVLRDRQARWRDRTPHVGVAAGAAGRGDQLGGRDESWIRSRRGTTRPRTSRPWPDRSRAGLIGAGRLGSARLAAPWTGSPCPVRSARSRAWRRRKPAPPGRR